MGTQRPVTDKLQWTDHKEIVTDAGAVAFIEKRRKAFRTFKFALLADADRHPLLIAELTVGVHNGLPVGAGAHEVIRSAGRDAITVHLLHGLQQPFLHLIEIGLRFRIMNNINGVFIKAAALKVDGSAGDHCIAINSSGRHRFRVDKHLMTTRPRQCHRMLSADGIECFQRWKFSHIELFFVEAAADDPAVF